MKRYTPIPTFPTEQVCAAFIRSEEFVADLKELAEKLGGGEFTVKCVAATPQRECPSCCRRARQSSYRRQLAVPSDP
jgi:hypothetical protein